MPGIFDDEGRETGPIWLNPTWPDLRGTRSIWALDSVAQGLKRPALRRLSRLASSQMGRADATTMILNRP